MNKNLQKMIESNLRQQESAMKQNEAKRLREAQLNNICGLICAQASYQTLAMFCRAMNPKL